MPKKRKKFGWLKITFLAIVSLAGGFSLYIWLSLPDVSEYESVFPEKTSFMNYRDAEYEMRGEKVRDDYRPVPMNRISKYLKMAAIASEDANFYSHDGIDMESLQEALEENWEKGKYARGGSTITQQLAKNLYLKPQKSIIRKIKEYLISRRLEEALVKDRILELYLNVAEWGKGIYGCEAASRRWFGKSCDDLTVPEAALLAGALPAPLKFNPNSQKSRAYYRAKKIIGWLCAGNKIPEGYCR